MCNRDSWNCPSRNDVVFLVIQSVSVKIPIKISFYSSFNWYQSGTVQQYPFSILLDRVFVGNNLEILCFFMYRLVSEFVLQTVSSSKYVSSKTIVFGFWDFVSKNVFQRVLEFQMLINCSDQSYSRWFTSTEYHHLLECVKFRLEPTSEANKPQNLWQWLQNLWRTSQSLLVARSYSLYQKRGHVMDLSEPLPNLHSGISSDPNLGLQMFLKSKIFLKDHIQQIHRGLSSVSNTELPSTSQKTKTTPTLTSMPTPLNPATFKIQHHEAEPLSFTLSCLGCNQLRQKSKEQCFLTSEEITEHKSRGSSSSYESQKMKIRIKVAHVKSHRASVDHLRGSVKHHRDSDAFKGKNLHFCNYGSAVNTLSRLPNRIFSPELDTRVPIRNTELPNRISSTPESELFASPELEI
ncbi:hypothetical protein OSB04_019955 [Centaurea solstitialis]|uniref:Uncharacterized protein n=1 Tax=Centaurea solstitialis TaxID=347529 RepID=A0AA38W5G6_9ASTR|nr:hypothetical protein OSB04_019955 [Centaurea solstitialis]